MKKLPKILYAKIEEERDGTTYAVCAEKATDLVETGQKLRIGTYQLVEMNDAEGVVKLTKR